MEGRGKLSHHHPNHHNHPHPINTHRRPHRKSMSHLKDQVIQQRSQDSTDSSSSGKKAKERKVTIREELLHDAALRNDAKLVQRILEIAYAHEHDLDREGVHYPTVLECARRGNREAVAVLISAKYDFEVTDKAGMTPLLLAAWSGQKEMIDLLIKVGANCLATTRSQETAIHLAARSEQIDVLTFLLDVHPFRFDVDARDREGRTAMHILAGNGGVDPICRLIRIGAHINLKDNVKRSPAHYAITSGFDEVLTLFLEQGIDPRQRDGEGRALIHLATEAGKTSAVRTLVEFNFDTSATDIKGRTALHLAASLGHKDMINLLLNNCASLEMRDLKGDRPLHLACVNNQVATVSLLLSKGAEVDAVNSRDQTPLHAAAELGYKDVVDVLIAFGADLSAMDRVGRTALYVAARGGHTDVADLIIKAERHLKLDGNDVHTINHHRRLSITSDNSHEDAYSMDQLNSALEEGLATQIQDVLSLVSRQHLHPQDWIQLARFWDFGEDQIEAIEHQYTGRNSYKDHGYRMMMIWLHSLPPNRHPMRELSSSLMAIGRGSLANKVVKRMTTTTTKFLYPDDKNAFIRFLLSPCHLSNVSCSIL